MRTSAGYLNPDPLRLFTMRTAAGYFFMNKKKFNKPALNILQQINLLKKRNLQIKDLDFLNHCLATVSYYRLSGYCKIFQNPDHTFKSNTKFTQIWELYTFDQELRLLVTKAIEKIEVTLRATISNFMSVNEGPRWYLKSSLFRNKDFHNKFMEQVNKICKDQKEVFLDHYYKYYLDEYPPSWMILECISFGTLSKVFCGFRNLRHKREMSVIFGYHPTLIESWFECLCYTRNLCAHHSRLWNRWFIMKPRIPNKYTTFTQLHSRIANKFYSQALTIILLLENICPEYDWQAELKALLHKYPEVPKQNMGFGENWIDDPLWKLQPRSVSGEHKIVRSATIQTQQLQELLIF